jgi:hypothetical protein
VNEETVTDEALRDRTIPQLVRQALDEARLLARAEVLHAKQELREEVLAAKKAGILLGVALVSALCGLSVVLVALALALPIPDALGALVVGGVLLCVAAVTGFLAQRALPRKPLPRTTERLKLDWLLAKERLA